MSRDFTANDIKVIWPDAHKRERPVNARWFGEYIGETPRVFMFKPEFDRAISYARECYMIADDTILDCRVQTPVYGLYDVSALGIKWITK
jgi:hypothetical protein